MLDVICPHCGAQYEGEPDWVGMTTECGECERDFVVQAPLAPASAPPKPTLSLRREPDPHAAAAAASAAADQPTSGPSVASYVAAAERLADVEDLDLSEHNHIRSGRAHDKPDARQEYRRWQSFLPDAPSAYIPSGKTTADGNAQMVAAAVIGAFTGPLRNLFIQAIGLTLYVIAGRINVWFDSAIDGVPVLGVVIQWFVVIVAIPLAHFLGAYSPSTGIAEAAQRGKSRSPGLVVAAASLSGLVNFVLTFIGMGIAAIFILPRVLPPAAHGFAPWEGGTGICFWLSMLTLAGSIYLVTVPLAASAVMASKKFCEDCQMHMQEITLRRITLGGLHVAAQAQHVDNQDALIGALFLDGEDTSGRPSLFCCPTCSQGVVDIIAWYDVTYPDSEGEAATMHHDWIVASTHLTPEQVAVVKTRELR